MGTGSSILGDLVGFGVVGEALGVTYLGAVHTLLRLGVSGLRQVVCPLVAKDKARSGAAWSQECSEPPLLALVLCSHPPLRGPESL